jgi:hypothetical protein
MSESPSLDLVSSYVADILERSHALQELAELAESGDDYVSLDAPSVISAIGKMAMEFRGAVLDQWTIYAKSRRHTDLMILRGIDEALRRVAGELRLPARATSGRIPGVLTRLMSTKAAALSDNASVILRPQWNYNYKIQRDDVHQHYEELLGEVLADDSIRRCLAEVKRPLYIISFPSIERNSIHLHAVLGHELGHLMARDYSPSTVADESFLSDIHRLLDSPQKKTGLSDEDADHGGTRNEQLDLLEKADIEKAVIARRTAIKEFAADAAGIFLFGIASVLGAAQVAMSRNPKGRRESDAQYYPTWGVRLVQMVKLAKSLGWWDLEFAAQGDKFSEATEAVKRRLTDIESWIGSGADRWHVLNPEIVAGHKSALNLLPEIHAYLEDGFSGAFASSQLTYSKLPMLFERLDDDIPPDNVGSEIDIQLPKLEDVFVASWWYRLCKVKPEFVQGDLAEKSRSASAKLRRLTLKAVENIDFVNRFRAELKIIKELP